MVKHDLEPNTVPDSGILVGWNQKRCLVLTSLDYVAQTSSIPRRWGREMGGGRVAGRYGMNPTRRQILFTAILSQF